MWRIMSSSYIVIGIFGVIDLVLAFYAYRNYFSKLSAKNSEIQFAIEQLQKYSVQDYSMRFEDINRLLLQNATIKDIWRDFSQNLTKSKSSEGRDELFAPVEAGEFFRYSLVIKDINNSFWQNFGSIYTGIGIFGTFLGLMIGLRGVDLSSSDVAVLKEGIGSLLSGISTAFGTSLLGILFALIYGAFNKNVQDKVAESVAQVAERIGEMYPRKTVEQWLSDGQRESVEQTKAIKNLSQEMAENLGELLDQQLSTNFDELCQKLDGQMKPVFEKLYNAISQLNEGGASAIAGAVNEKAGAQLDAFADVLQNLQETMKQSLETSEKTSSQANTILLDTMNQIAASLKQSTDENMKKQQESTDQMGDQMKQLIATFSQSTEQAMKNMLVASNAAQQEMNDSVTQTKTSAQNIVSAVQEMTEKHCALLEESVNANKQKVDDTVAILRETIKESNSTLGQSYSAIKDMAETLEDLLKKTQTAGKSMENSVAPIIEATNILKQQLETVQEQTNRLHEETATQIDKLFEQGLLTEQSLMKMSESVSAAENTAVEAWNTYKEGLTGIGDELSTVLNELNDNMSQYNQKMNDGMKEKLSEFDKSVGNAVAQLATVIEELNDLVEDLTGNNRDRK